MNWYQKGSQYVAFLLHLVGLFIILGRFLSYYIDYDGRGLFVFTESIWYQKIIGILKYIQ